MQCCFIIFYTSIVLYCYFLTNELYIFLYMSVVENDTAVTPYRWQQGNDLILWSDANSLGMGGGGKGFAFVVSDDFHNGDSNRSGTFENSPFVKNNSFSVDNVEVWGFKKYFDNRNIGYTGGRSTSRRY